MEHWMLSELKDVLHCEIPVEAEISCVSTDTRDLPKGCLFLALRGEKFDGHNFVKQAIEAGAVAAVTEEQIEDCPCLVVSSTGQALLDIGNFYRKKFNPVLVGVTGSVGKTTTKEMIATVLEAQFHTLKTQGNFNNEIGMPKTLMGLDSTYEAAVIEMGMSHFGEIHRMTLAAEPCIGVITNIGFSHVENLGSQEGILKAKTELLDGMAEDAPLIVNGDDSHLAPLKETLNRPVYTYGIYSDTVDVRGVNLKSTATSTEFDILTKDGKQYPVTLPCVGEHNVMNALAAFQVGTLAGIAPEKICSALAQYKTVGFRQNFSKRKGATVIADCYNASPDSMRAAFRVLGEVETTGRRIAVLGDMLELGAMSETLHTMVGTMAKESKADAVFCLGNEAAHIAKVVAETDKTVSHTTDREKLVQELQNYVKPGDTVLFKGSRGMHLEDIMTAALGQEE